MNKAVLAPVALAPVSADASLCGSRIGIVAGIQDHLLQVAEEGFQRIVVGTSLGQTDPVQLEFPHHFAGEAGLAGVSTVLIQDYPYLLGRIPAAEPAQGAGHLRGVFLAVEGPAYPPTIDLVEAEEIEEAPGFLVAWDLQVPSRGVAPSSVGLDRDGLLVEEQEQARAGPVPPSRANPGQNRGPLRVIAAELALEAPEADAPFLSRRRRCSRLMLLSR